MNEWLKKLFEPQAEPAREKPQRPAAKWRNLWMIPPNSVLKTPEGKKFPPGRHWGSETFSTREIAETVAMEQIADDPQRFHQPGELLTTDERRIIYLGPYPRD